MKLVNCNLPATSGMAITFCIITTFLLTMNWQAARAQAPAISSFTPAMGTAGTLVTISGINLGNPQTLTIGGVNAIPVSNDGTTLVAMVMPGATSGSVAISNAGGTATGAGHFTMQASGSAFTQQNSKLTGSGSVGSSRQGNAVSISADGNTAVVGAPFDNSNQGAAWIFTRSGGVWGQQGTKLVGTGAIGAAQQGTSVAISADGNTVLIGGRADNNNIGAVWVFTRSGSVWAQQGTKLVGTNDQPYGGNVWQGYSVALSADGNTAAVGGYGLGSNQGGTWVFTRNAGVWTQQGSKLFGTGAIMNTAGQGYSVALSADGNTLLSGGYMDGWAYGIATGATWVFTRNAGVWTQQGTKLTGTGYVAGNVAQGSGVALSADGNTALIGGYADNNQKGAAWVFTRSAGVWTQQGSKLVGTGASGNSEQGFSVALSADGNTAIVGGWRDVNVIGGGMWVFKRTGITWSQAGNRLNGTGNVGGAYQGNAVSLSADGSTAIMGAYWDAGQVGASWVFHTDPVTLPLYWLSIDAKVVLKKEVVISWTTSAEINTSYFEVERSTGNAGQYISIGTVSAKNTMNTVNSYALSDRNIDVEGTIYYRIKQVDLDGRFAYSPVKSVRFNADQENTGWLVYPNPVRRNEGINLTAVGGGIRADDAIQVELMTNMGQVIYQATGVLSGAAKSINERLRSLSAGVYTVVIRYKGEKQALQLVVQ